jgi:hypothetical protein
LSGSKAGSNCFLLLFAVQNFSQTTSDGGAKARHPQPMPYAENHTQAITRNTLLDDWRTTGQDRLRQLFGCGDL